MPLIQVLLVLGVIGVVLWLLNNYGAAYIDAKFVSTLSPSSERLSGC
jgi:uncharacterized membrane protein (Fun14 family)